MGYKLNTSSNGNYTVFQFLFPKQEYVNISIKLSPSYYIVDYHLILTYIQVSYKKLFVKLSNLNQFGLTGQTNNKGERVLP